MMKTKKKLILVRAVIEEYIFRGLTNDEEWRQNLTLDKVTVFTGS